MNDPMSHRRRLASEQGFTLVELMVAAMVLVIGVLGVITLLDHANRATTRTKHREAGISLARELIEASRAVPYPSLIPADFVSSLQAQPGLDDIEGGGSWTVQRRNTTYTITADVCSVDDNTITSDGLGDHTGGFYCAGQPELAGGATPTDKNPDDYKRVAINVTWQDGAATRTVRQEAVLNNPGSAFAPAIKTLTMTPASPITSSGTSSLSFAATTNIRAQRVMWSLDNVDQAAATTTNNVAFSFAWPIGTAFGTAGFVEDGTYLITTQAFDDSGETGNGRSLTVVLNRFQPRAPTGFRGGRGSWGAEFEWGPNNERDIVSYRVYRVASSASAPSGSDDLVCEKSVEDALPTYCRDPLPSAQDQYYYVVAVAPARVGTGLEESPRPATLAASLKVVPGSSPPAAPSNLAAAADASGVTLSWTAPADTDIHYYRIYRDGTLYESRYDRTSSASQLTYTDTNPGTVTHTYYVTAVDAEMAESPFTSGVTG
jgi:prepilin-type N-terminal cleavage/methylation domain-containing protein